MKDGRFYHHEGATATVTKSLKSLWATGKSWGANFKGSIAKSPTVYLPALETQVEDEYYREVVIGSKIL